MRKSLVGDNALAGYSFIRNLRFTASCLRILATHHIYREVKPNVFANNRVSSLLDTSKPSAEIIAEYVTPPHAPQKGLIDTCKAQLVNMMIQMESQLLWELC